MKDYQTAGYHFKTCIELEPGFPDVYYHYIHLLVFLNMEKQVATIKLKAITTPGVGTAGIYNLLGLMAEKNKSWKEAASLYEEAFFEATDKTQKEETEENMARLRAKINRVKPYNYTLGE